MESTLHTTSFRLLSEQPGEHPSVEVAANQDKKDGRRRVWCKFASKGGDRLGLVEVVHAPVKTMARMREKLGKCLTCKNKQKHQNRHPLSRCVPGIDAPK